MSSAPRPSLYWISWFATCSDRHHLYAHGLLGFDTWVFNQRGCKFADMLEEDQIMLFRAAQPIYEDWTPGAALVVKARRGLRAAIRARNGSYVISRSIVCADQKCLLPGVLHGSGKLNTAGLRRSPNGPGISEPEEPALTHVCAVAHPVPQC
jgi:hypothetical protein